MHHGGKSREPILKYLRSQVEYIVCLTHTNNSWATKYIDLMIEVDLFEPDNTLIKLKE